MRVGKSSLELSIMTARLKFIREIMSRHVVSVDLQDTIEKVEHVPNQRKISSAPVVDFSADGRKSECFGIICLRDIAYFHGMKKIRNRLMHGKSAATGRMRSVRICRSPMRRKS
jgi:CBS-domain-containing membrane protein